MSALKRLAEPGADVVGEGVEFAVAIEVDRRARGVKDHSALVAVFQVVHQLFFQGFVNIPVEKI